MVLIIMVGILVYRGYVIMNPPPEPPISPYRPPATEVTSGVVEDVPPVVQPRPPMDVPQTYSDLQQRNPFRYNVRAGGDSDGVAVEDLGITVLSILEGGGQWRARIRAANRTGWYTVNDETDTFEVLEINPEEETVVIMSKRYNRRFTLSLQ